MYACLEAQCIDSFQQLGCTWSIILQPTRLHLQDARWLAAGPNGQTNARVKWKSNARQQSSAGRIVADDGAFPSPLIHWLPLTARISKGNEQASRAAANHQLRCKSSPDERWPRNVGRLGLRNFVSRASQGRRLRDRHQPDP